MKWFVLTHTTLSYFNTLSEKQQNREPRRSISLSDVAQVKLVDVDVSGSACSFVRVHLLCHRSAYQCFAMCNVSDWPPALPNFCMHTDYRKL